MSIQTIVKSFAIASLLSLGLAGVSWSEDAEQKDAGDTASVEAPPPADAADTDADAENAETADSEKAKDAKD